MNGTTHATIGAATGFIIANTAQVDTTTTFVFIGLGTVSALIPDLDIDGKLRGKLTLSHKMIQSITQLIGILMIIYSYFEVENTSKFISMGIGVIILFFSSILKQKHMLTLTAIGLIIGGSSIQEIWLILFGVYTLIASVVSHRSYTHSILGVVYFGIIAKYLETSLEIQGVYYVCLISYTSHLILDSKYLPFNKRGIKLFLPISSKEF